jgi:predicted transcriptional regulator
MKANTYHVRNSKIRVVPMSAIKDRMTQIVQSQPDDASYEVIMRELAFERIIFRGLEDLRAGRVISNEEAERRIRSWEGEAS